MKTANAVQKQQTEILAAILSELQAIHATLKPVSDTDGATLLREIHRGAQKLPFTAADLILRSEIIFNESGDAQLHAAIVAVVGSLNCRKLGRWLADHEGVPIGEYCLHRADHAGRDGVLWVCESGSRQTHCAKAKAAR